jgi:FkbM family methyltransferase
VTRTLIGRQLTVRDGTFTETPDYDDAWLYACAQHSKIAFDVGANVGQSAMLMMLSQGVKRVVLVDANSDALAVAADNLIRNQFSISCQFVRGFAGEHSDATIDFWTVGTGAAGSIFKGHAHTAARAGSVRSVPTISLDKLSELYGVTPDFVKVDVEGAEHDVLLGSKRFASHRRTRFLVEMHSPPELPMERNAALVLEWAASLGYSAWYLSEAVKLDDPQRIARRGRCHLLLQPADWPFPEWLVGIKQSASLPTSQRAP